MCIQNVFAKFDFLTLTMTSLRKRPTHARKVPNYRPATKSTNAVDKLCAKIAAGTAEARTQMAAAV